MPALAGLSLYNHPLSPMASPSSAPASRIPIFARKRSRNTIVIAFLLISALYFADTFLRASLKTFWYDEIITVLLCRLPSFAATWTAVLHGADFDPPLFISSPAGDQEPLRRRPHRSRLPAMVGFWVFCICIFVFVRRRLGPLYGASRPSFPFSRWRTPTPMRRAPTALSRLVRPDAGVLAARTRGSQSLPVDARALSQFASPHC